MWCKKIIKFCNFLINVWRGISKLSIVFVIGIGQWFFKNYINHNKKIPTVLYPLTTCINGFPWNSFLTFYVREMFYLTIRTIYLVTITTNNNKNYTLKKQNTLLSLKTKPYKKNDPLKNAIWCHLHDFSNSTKSTKYANP